MPGCEKSVFATATSAAATAGSLAKLIEQLRDRQPRCVRGVVVVVFLTASSATAVAGTRTVVAGLVTPRRGVGGIGGVGVSGLRCG